MGYLVSYVVGIIVYANVMEIYRKKQSVLHQQEKDIPNHDYENCICYEQSYWWWSSGSDPRVFELFLWPLSVFLIIPHLWNIVVWIVLLPSNLPLLQKKRGLTEKEIDTMLAEVHELIKK